MFIVRALLHLKYIIGCVLAVLLGVSISNGLGLGKITLKSLDFMNEFQSIKTDCYPPDVDKQRFLVEILIAVATGFVHPSEKTKCFPFCLMKHYKIMNDEGQVDPEAVKPLASRIVHEKMKNIVLDNLDACNALVKGSTDGCLNGLNYARCFAKMGVFVYAHPEDFEYPLANSSKSKLLKFMRKMSGR